MKEEETLADDQSLMTAIINIQMMREVIYEDDPHYDYDKQADFEKLKVMTSKELHDLQSSLLPIYNEVTQKRDPSKRLTVKEKVRLYTRVREDLMKKEYHYICEAIFWILQNEFNVGIEEADELTGDEDEFKEHFPELFAYKPEDKDIEEGWFGNKYEGRTKRIEVVNEILTKLESKTK